MNAASDGAAKLSVWLQGGLGNQLFQLNAGLVASRLLDVPLSLSRVSFIRDRLRNYELAPLARDLSIESLLKSLWVGSPYKDGHLRQETARGGRPISTTIPQAQIGGMLVGFFQDQESVANGTQLTVERLTGVALSQAAATLRERTAGRAVAHVRRGDYVTLDSARRTFGQLTDRYYGLAFKELGVDRDEVIYFTDDPEYVMAEYGVRREFVISEQDLRSPLETIVVMGAAASIVIPNSSFSWWSSEIVASRDGRVVAPERWFLDRSPSLAPSRPHWTVVENC